MNRTIADITAEIEARSERTRSTYLEMIRRRRPSGYARNRVSEGNLAHAAAGCSVLDKADMLGAGWPNIGIITAYNDMLSAHAPFEHYPVVIRDAARQAGAVAQVAGGVPAMCDGVTQGQQGMELSLFSRDVIAMASAIGLSHDVYDAALHLGVCDKIIPGLLIAALRFGWIPSIFIPAGPMPSGLSNPEKIRIRQAFAEGKVDRAELLRAESESYHSQGTCTFYGTANSNQMLMELLGLHLPGAAFINPGTPLRDALTRAATTRAAAITAQSDNYLPIGELIDARSIVNGIVGLMATGGSTNHVLHIPAIAAAAGYRVTLDDFDAISQVTPLLCRIYPNGPADVNHFHAAGGMGFLIGELLKAGLIHGNAQGVAGPISSYASEPKLRGDELAWQPAPKTSLDLDILRPASDPFTPNGGLRLMTGALGRGISKTSAVKDDHRRIEALARVFETQADFKAAFDAGELDMDMIAVIRFQGPAANGMPELHALTPALGVLQDRGHKVALITDGRMSGASGKVPSAIHITPEAIRGGPIARIQDDDLILLDTNTGSLEIKVDPDEFAARPIARTTTNTPVVGLGREMFAGLRATVSDAELGASVFGLPSVEPL